VLKIKQKNMSKNKKDDWTKVEPELTPAWNGKDDKGKFELEVGDEITGIYKDKKEDVGPNNVIIYEIETDEGLIAVWGSSVLDTRMKNIENGTMVKIVYLGEKKSQKTKRVYRDYEVYMREAAYEDIPVVDADEDINPSDIPF